MFDCLFHSFSFFVKDFVLLDAIFGEGSFHFCHLRCGWLCARLASIVELDDWVSPFEPEDLTELEPQQTPICRLSDDVLESMIKDDRKLVLFSFLCHYLIVFSSCTASGS